MPITCRDQPKENTDPGFLMPVPLPVYGKVVNKLVKIIFCTNGNDCMNFLSMVYVQNQDVLNPAKLLDAIDM